MNKEIIETIKSTKTVDELKEVASRSGYTLTDKDAKGYFEMYHTKGKIGENDLDNIAGGACSKFCNFKAYGGDNNLLIVRDINDCLGFDYRDGEWGEHFCDKCKYVMHDGITMYCTQRTYDDDPYNIMIGTTRKHLGHNRYW